jgi:hypothetical protein
MFSRSGAVTAWGRALRSGERRSAQAEGEIDPAVEIRPLARMLAAALKEAGVMIATAPDAGRARAEASRSARRLISGLLARP